MYGIFTNIYPINDPNVGKYTIHGASGQLLLGTRPGKRLQKTDGKDPPCYENG